MTDDIKNRLKELKSRVQCDNNFHCCSDGFKNLCNARVIGDGLLVDCTNCDPATCLRSDPSKCQRRTPFGFGHFCTCPVRVFVAQFPDTMA